MKTTARGQQLIRELLSDPAGFCARGDDYELVQECFEGFPVEKLRPLLALSDQAVRRAIIWPVSELGNAAWPLIDEAVLLVCDEDRYIRSYALDIVAVCAVAEDANKYVHVVRALGDSDDAVSEETMFLISNAERSQLESALQSLGDSSSDNAHRLGILKLVSDQPDVGVLSSMIDSPEPLLRKYGAIAAWRYRANFPELASRLASNGDPSIKKFWERRVNRQA